MDANLSLEVLNGLSPNRGQFRLKIGFGSGDRFESKARSV